MTDVVGVDPSQEMINRGVIAFPNLQLLHNTKSRLPFMDDYFDLIVVCGVFTCIADETQCSCIMTELNRLLKLNGIIHIVEFCHELGHSSVNDIGITMKHRTPKQMSELVNTFKMLSSEVKTTTTISGRQANAYNYFGIKVI